MTTARPLAERFDRKYTILEPNGCWIWTACLKTGYGSLQVLGRLVRAHRVSYELHVGPIPTGMHCLHRCDNKLCVNPSHLYLGTHADNMKDKANKKRAPSGENHKNAKLTEADVTEIRSIAGEMRQVDIATRFGVHRAHISNIINHKWWR